MSLAADLVKKFETGAFSDVEFIIGPDCEVVRSHKFILRARSPVFVTMLEERWNSDKDGVIKLPQHRLQPFKAFLKFLYSNELEDSNEDIFDLIEMMQLGKMYEVSSLVVLLTSSIRQKMLINLDLSWTIYETLKETFPILAEEAFELSKKVILSVITRDDFENFEAKTVIKILNSEGMDIKEIELFEAVKRWTGVDEEKKAIAKNEMIPLIRFPLMDMKEISKFVIHSGLLSKTQIINLFEFFSDKIYPVGDEDEAFGYPQSLSEMLFKYRSRMPKLAKDYEQLKLYLKEAVPGDVIQLAAGQTYFGLFTLDKWFITLEGKGKPYPIISRFGLFIKGRNCNISNIKVATSNAPAAVEVSGIGHILGNLKIETKRHELPRNNQTFFGVKCEGIYLESSKNVVLEDILTIEDEEKSSVKRFLLIKPNCKNVKVSNCQSKFPIFVEGENVEFSKVITGSEIFVEGIGHKFFDCSAKKWENNTDQAVFENCSGEGINSIFSSNLTSSKEPSISTKNFEKFKK